MRIGIICMSIGEYMNLTIFVYNGTMRALIGSKVPVRMFTCTQTWHHLQHMMDHVGRDRVALGIQTSSRPDLEEVGGTFVKLIRLALIYIFGMMRNAVVVHRPSVYVACGRDQSLPLEIRTWQPCELMTRALDMRAGLLLR